MLCARAGCLPFLLASFHVYSRLNMKFTAEMLTGSAQASTVAEECFGNIRTVRCQSMQHDV